MASSPRRIGAPDAKNRTVLLDAAEQLLIEEGYAAVTSRHVAARAGLKPQLVHYYFRSMDELFLAVFRRRAEEGLRRQAEILASDRPLEALWAFSTDSATAVFTTEFIALANHRKAIGAEIATWSDRIREARSEALSGLIEQRGLDPGTYPPAAMAVLLTSVAQVMVMERNLGISTGHQEILDLLRRFLDRLEPDPQPPGE